MLATLLSFPVAPGDGPTRTVCRSLVLDDGTLGSVQISVGH